MCPSVRFTLPRRALNLPVSMYIVESALIRSARSSIAAAISNYDLLGSVSFSW